MWLENTEGYHQGWIDGCNSRGRYSKEELQEACDKARKEGYDEASARLANAYAEGKGIENPHFWTYTYEDGYMVKTTEPIHDGDQLLENMDKHGKFELSYE